MNRDAKIGIAVILIIVGFLVVIWGRDRNEEPFDADLTSLREPDTSGPVLNIDIRPPSRTGGMRAVSPEEGRRVVAAEEITPPAIPPSDPITVLTPPADPEPAQPEPRNRQYTVAPGDSLIKIARTQLGDENRWGEIARLNNIPEPYTVQVDQKLTLPPRATAAASTTITTEPETETETATAAPAEPAGNYRKYTVQPGDSLVLIALEQLHDQSKWKKIAEINGLSDPDKLRPGRVILLPE